MLFKVPKTQNHSSTDVVKHELKNTLTTLSLKIQVAQKFISKGVPSDPSIQTAIQVLSSTQKEINELTRKIEEET